MFDNIVILIVNQNPKIMFKMFQKEIRDIETNMAGYVANKSQWNKIYTYRFYYEKKTGVNYMANFCRIYR